MTKLLIATGNQGKLVEIQALLSDLNLDLTNLPHLGINLRVEEDGDSYKENARRKAQAYSRACGLLTLADDSGLEVKALGGRPGIFSARFAPQSGATDADRRAYLLHLLREKKPPWKARFVCCVAIASPGGALNVFDGYCLGEIVPEERGQNGFGYDPIFFFPEVGLTMAELTMEQKNRFSHRAQAVNKSRSYLLNLLSETP